jgi:hypothetical protein
LPPQQVSQQMPPQQMPPRQAPPVPPQHAQQPPVQQPQQPQQTQPAPPWPMTGPPQTVPVQPISVPPIPVQPNRPVPPTAAQQGLPVPRPPQLNPPSPISGPPVGMGSPVVGVPPQQTLIPAPRPKRGRGVLVGSLIAAFVAVIAAGAAVYLVLNNKTGSPENSGTQPASNVALSVRDDRVTLTWTDPSNGVAQPIIVGFRESEGLRRFAVPAKGSTEAVIPGLNKNYNYCFAVVLVYTEDDVKQSEQVCTDRKGASPSPSR